MTHRKVVVGPWTGSAAVPAAARSRRSRRPIPNRWRTKWGGRQLMDCRECCRPFAPDIEIPPGRLCAQCRAEREAAQPALIDRRDLEGDRDG